MNERLSTQQRMLVTFYWHSAYQTGILEASAGALVVCLAVCMIRGKTLAQILAWLKLIKYIPRK